MRTQLCCTCKPHDHIVDDVLALLKLKKKKESVRRMFICHFAVLRRFVRLLYLCSSCDVRLDFNFSCQGLDLFVLQKYQKGQHLIPIFNYDRDGALVCKSSLLGKRQQYVSKLSFIYIFEIHVLSVNLTSQ